MSQYVDHLDRERQIIRLALLAVEGHADECVALSHAMLAEQNVWMETDKATSDFVAIVCILSAALDRLGRNSEALPWLVLAAEACMSLPHEMSSFVVSKYVDALRHAGRDLEADDVLVEHLRDIDGEGISIAPAFLGDIRQLDRLSDEDMELLWLAMDSLVERFNLDRDEFHVTRQRHDYHRRLEDIRTAIEVKRFGT